jgi:hypothetical protein
MGAWRDNPAREQQSKLTERSKNQRQDYHRERTQPASKAYADGWDRIWGHKARWGWMDRKGKGDK